MAEALCNGVVALRCGGDLGADRVRGAAAALAKSVPIGGYSIKSSFLGGRMTVTDRKARPLPRGLEAAPGQMNLTISKAMRWWEKGVQPNMREIESAQDLADSLLNAGDKLVAVDFFSPGCGGCRALHPKIAQFAEKNPDVLFLQVNYETHKSMCYSLHVHVLPFFRLYRGAQGRVSSFSCTNATIKKFKDALAKHGPQRCSLGPAKGLEESELMALAANRDLQFTYEKPGLVPIADAIAKEAAAPGGPWFSLPASATQLLTQGSETLLLWPPIRSYRKNTMAMNLPAPKSKDDAEAKQALAQGCLYVKVSMDGAPYLRKVDLKMYKNYKELSLALEKMFSCFTVGHSESNEKSGREGLSDCRLLDLKNGTELVLTYEDKDGDWMLVGDVPWRMFTDSCKRLRIMKGSDAVGLAPRTSEKSRNHN